MRQPGIALYHCLKAAVVTGSLGIVTLLNQNPREGQQSTGLAPRELHRTPVGGFSRFQRTKPLFRQPQIIKNCPPIFVLGISRGCPELVAGLLKPLKAIQESAVIHAPPGVTTI